MGNFFRQGMTLVLTLMLAACANPAPTSAGATATSQAEQRLSDLERRVERLEARPPVEEPLRDRAAIQDHIQKLEAERVKLLVKYTEMHPAVRDIDRKLRILNEQLSRLEP